MNPGWCEDHLDYITLLKYCLLKRFTRIFCCQCCQLATVFEISICILPIQRMSMLHVVYKNCRIPLAFCHFLSWNSDCGGIFIKNGKKLNIWCMCGFVSRNPNENKKTKQMKTKQNKTKHFYIWNSQFGGFASFLTSNDLCSIILALKTYYKHCFLHVMPFPAMYPRNNISEYLTSWFFQYFQLW